MNYRGIRNLDELDKAIAGNNQLRQKMEGRLKRHTQLAREFYTPSTLLGEGVRRVGNSVSFYGVLLALLEQSRRRRKNKRLK